jgi:4-carboxymuconolactone decarboxylase
MRTGLMWGGFLRSAGASALTLILAIPAAAPAQDRMPPIPPQKMTEPQRQVAIELQNARGYALRGPWHPLLRSPDLMGRILELSDYLRFNSALPPRLSEFVILMTAREWTQQYEWQAHLPLALKGGLKPEIAQAVAEGRRPDGMAEDEAALYDLISELLHNKSVSDDTYARALAKFGEQGVVDAVAISGYYTTIAMIMNTARTPLPDGMALPLKPWP